MTVILLFCFDNLSAQNLITDKYKNTTPAFQHQLTPTALQDSLNSLRSTSPSFLYGLDFAIKSSLPNKTTEQRGSRYISTWKFLHKQIASRFLFGLKDLKASDSLLIFDKEGILTEIVSGDFPEYFSSEANADGQYVQLRSDEASVRFSFLRISAEPLGLSKSKNNGFGDSQPCQVNVNCYENTEAIDDMESAVVRILIRKGNLMGFCTGTLMNNTSYDLTPYILTAEHCGIISEEFINQADLDGWAFYFNYAAPNCENPASEGNLALQKMVGAEMMARSYDQGGETGSDFLLLKLKGAIPASYDVYYAGWNRSALDIPHEGYSIHHPEGDVKKISVYETPPDQGSFGQNINYSTHWLVNWSPSHFGFGTTEQGSSGAALFDQEKRVRGQLTGGFSSCAEPNGQDYFGMLNQSWNIGKPSDNNLQAWLDPLSKGYLALDGTANGEAPTNISDVKIYPSPAADYIIIGNLSPYKELHLTISHINGKVVYDRYVVSAETGIKRIELENWAQGVYIAYIHSGEVLHTYKFMIK